jgi:elongation factor G
MKKFSTEDIRNVVLVGGGGAGKTTLAEAMLFAAGATTRLGSVDEGNSVLDYDPDEIARKVSISSSLATFEWKKKKINLLDTPGYANFLTDTYGAVRVADAALVVVSAVDGVKVETEKVWKLADQYSHPRIIFISKIDKDRADHEKVIDSINRVFGNRAVPFLLPDVAGPEVSRYLDVVHQRTISKAPDGTWSVVADMDEATRGSIGSHRERLIEASSDELIEKYLEHGSVDEGELDMALKDAVRTGKVYPVYCGSSLSSAGAPQVLDAILTFLPSPIDRGNLTGKNPDGGGDETREPSEKAPFSALVFKTIADPYAGRITLFRVYSGVIHSDASLYNATKGIKERFGQIFFMVGKTQAPITDLVPGDIAGVAKLKETATGDTISDEKHPVLYDFVSLPKPAISFAIEPKTKGDDEKVGQALHRLTEEDLSLHVGRDPQTHEMILSGLGQMHLEVILARLKRKFGVEVVMHEPKIPYKETIKGHTKVQGRHKKQTGGRGQFGDCWLEIEPLPRGGGFEYVDRIVGGAVPRNFIPAVEKGIVESLDRGPLAGYPVVDVRVTIYDGSFHTVDSSEMAFKIAGRKGFKKGILESKPVLLEPIMNIDVSVPDECMGDIIGDLNSRRGRVVGVDSTGSGQTIKAKVPMAEVLKYSSDLRSMTQGRGGFDIEFSHYEEVPGQLAEKIIALSKKEHEEEEDE